MDKKVTTYQTKEQKRPQNLDTTTKLIWLTLQYENKTE